MKNTNVRTSAVIGLLLVTGQFISCDKKVITTNENTATIIENTKIEEIKTEVFRQPVVFITGIDKETNEFYKKAREYFLNKKYEVVDYTFSLQEIFSWLNNNYDGNTYGEIHIVSHGNPWKGLSMETLINGERVTTEHVRRAITMGKLPTLKEG
ncbi:MAG: hypothetical protein HOL35_05215, partial [Flavobacterium sp.]|nr:hypothetical protein [Flavobacterium sp.]